MRENVFAYLCAQGILTLGPVLGRIAQEQQSPLGSSGSVYSFQYTYDQMGNVLTSNNGLSSGTPLSFQFTYSTANRLSLATTTSMPWTESAAYPATLFRANAQTATNYGVAYSPVGWANAEFGILSSNASTSGIAKARAYDVRLRTVAESDVAPGGVTATSGTGTVTLSGSEQRACNTGVGNNAVVAGGGTRTLVQPQLGGGGGLCTWVYDSGRLWLTINNVSISILYSQTSTPTTLAAALRTAINTATSYPVMAGGTGVTVTLQATTTGAATNYTISSSGEPDNTLFSTTSFTINTTASTLTGGANSNATALYGYSLSYDSGSRVSGFSDVVMGDWAFGYDGVNRLTSGTSSSGPYAGGTLNWSYDAFGNRTAETGSGNANLPSTTVGIDNTNRLSSTPASPTAGSLLSYYDAGALTFDGTSSYLYDAEGRLCAVHTQAGMVGYVYDAEGARTATGALATFACGATLTPAKQFLLGLGGEQVTELDGSNNWQHTNVYAGCAQLATYDSLGVHYSLTDWLGTKHVQALASGAVDTTFVSLPFGNGPSNAGATEHRYTGKERDAESGLDYFGARYYASNMGRWMSPDWNSVPDSVPYANLSDPQSLNLYSYTRNNPLSRSDPDGHCDIDGEHHGGVWCFFHKLGLTETQHEVANDLRTYYQGLTYTPKNGSPIDVAGQSDADIIKFNQDHREEFANAHWAIGLAGPIAAGASGAMLGANGTQVTSKTLWQDGSEHIDVENPNPGQRPGQIHYQDSANNKYIYDVKTGQFEGLSNSQSKQLLSKPEVQQAIQKGLNYLGEGK